MHKFKLIFLSIFILFSACNSYADDNVRDYLYSEAYFDYLIECANERAIEEKNSVQKEETITEENEITAFEFDENTTQYEPFKLKIEETSTISKYGETFKKPETKIVIPTSEKFSFIYNTSQYINKNYTDGRRITSGIEFTPIKNLNFATGIETNYRDVDQNPLSRKIYFSPSIKINEYLTISFLNKINMQTHSSDHDLGLYISPFKTKAIDFKIFTGFTNESSGANSQSASFYTNFYFF